MEYGNFRKEIMSSQKKSLGKRKAEEEAEKRRKEKEAAVKIYKEKKVIKNTNLY